VTAREPLSRAPFPLGPVGQSLDAYRKDDILIFPGGNLEWAAVHAYKYYLDDKHRVVDDCRAA
jgi:hypothetical protein